MKHHLLYFIVLILSASACSVGNSTNPIPVATSFSNGVYSGKFTSLHLHEKTGITDTTVINLQLTFSNSNGFQVTGDTLLHAGSYGTYTIGANSYVLFVDKTAPAGSTVSKIHLNGIYLYDYSGSTISLGISSAFDTLKYFYDLKKQ